MKKGDNYLEKHRHWRRQRAVGFSITFYGCPEMLSEMLLADTEF
ncbi:hypothetical protein SAMN05660479_03370 [Microbulbifer thermotolerans]|nr:hypothetical protein SAMN05660479_03370 [Microbulbifer thermotolerans]